MVKEIALKDTFVVIAVTCLFMALLMLTGRREAFAEILSLYGTVDSQIRKQEKNSYSQQYDVNYDLELTQALNFDANLGYFKSDQDGVTTERISPNGHLLLKNDYFQFDLTGSTNERNTSDDDEYKAQAWEAMLGTNWREDYLPSIRFTHGESRQDDENGTSGLKSETKGYNTTAYVFWQYDDFDINYQFNDRRNNDLISGDDNETENHFVKIRGQKSLWDNRLDLGVGQQYIKDTNKQTVTVQPGESPLFQIFPTQALSAEDDSPEEGQLPENALLIDTDRESPALTVVSEQFMNIGVQTNFQQVDFIHLYTTDDIDLVEANMFTFSIYSSSNGINWTLEHKDLRAIYDDDENFFSLEIVPALRSQFVKAVVTNSPDEDVDISEIELFRLGTEDSLDRTYKQYLTDVNVSLWIVDGLTGYYNFSYDEKTSSIDPDNNTLRQSGGLSWIIADDLDFRLEASENRVRVDTLEDSINRTYSANMSWTPLNTLDLNFGFNRSDSYEDDNKVSSSDNYNLNANALLYPDLTADLWISYSNNTNKNSDSAQRMADFFLSIDADLTADIHLSSDIDYTKNFDDKSDPATWNSTIDWRPSSSFSLRGGLRIADATTTFLADTQMFLLQTMKTQVSLNASYIGPDEPTSNYGFIWSWVGSRYLALQGQMNYSHGPDGDDYLISGRLTINTAIF